jgi:hypothetical protein
VDSTRCNASVVDSSSAGSASPTAVVGDGGGSTVEGSGVTTIPRLGNGSATVVVATGLGAAFGSGSASSTSRGRRRRAKEAARLRICRFSSETSHVTPSSKAEPPAQT